MTISIASRHITATEALRNFAESKVDQALDNLSDRVRHVWVRFGKVAKAPWRKPMQCEIVVEMTTGQTLVVKERDPDLYLAIAEAGRRLREHLGKRHRLMERHRRIRAARKRRERTA